MKNIEIKNGKHQVEICAFNLLGKKHLKEYG